MCFESPVPDDEPHENYSRVKPNMPQQNPHPTVVAVYELVATRYRRVAEFRLATTGTVALTLAEAGGCPMARRWLRDGLRVPGTSQTVTADDGPAFMRALLLPRPVRYSRVVDESPGPAAADVRRRRSAGSGEPQRRSRT